MVSLVLHPLQNIYWALPSRMMEEFIENILTLLGSLTTVHLGNCQRMDCKPLVHEHR